MRDACLSEIDEDETTIVENEKQTTGMITLKRAGTKKYHSLGAVTPKLTSSCTVNDTAMKKVWKPENPSDTLVRKRHRPICCSVDGQKRYLISMEHRREREAIPLHAPYFDKSSSVR
jgi:hypothetical protein